MRVILVFKFCGLIATHLNELQMSVIPFRSVLVECGVSVKSAPI